MNDRPAPAQQPYPWLVPDLFRWFGLLLVNIAGVVVSWWGISGTPHLSGQFSWLDVGVAAVVIGGLGNMTWLLQGRRALAIRRRMLLARVETNAGVTAEPYPGDDVVRFTVPGTMRYHRAGCAALAGKPARRMTIAKHESAGRRACGLCDG